MITDNIKNCDLYADLHKGFKEAFEFLKTLNADTPTDSYMAGENKASVSHMNTTSFTKDGAKKPVEAHKKYIDIHYIVSGSEKFGYANTLKLKPTCEYNEELDYVFLEGNVDMITLSDGDFVITYPDDAHLPCLPIDEEAPIVRGVIKIPV